MATVMVDDTSTTHSIYGPPDGPETYPAGRRCPSCHAFLSTYNAGPLCHPCRDRMAAQQPAPYSRTASAEDAESVLALLRDGQWWTAAQLSTVLGVNRPSIYATVKRLSEAGHEIVSQAGYGTHLVREAPAPSPVVVRHVGDPYPAPEDPAGALSCEPDADPAQQQSANTGGAASPSLLRPFAGMVISKPYSREVRIICELDELDEGARARVLVWANERWAT